MKRKAVWRFIGVFISCSVVFSLILGAIRGPQMSLSQSWAYGMSLGVICAIAYMLLAVLIENIPNSKADEE